MRKSILLFILQTLTIISFCQQTNPSQTLTKQDYLKKSKNQNTAGGIMACSGAVLILATVFIFDQEEVVNSSPTSGVNIGYSVDTKEFKPVTGIAGTMAILGSIPLFIASAKNKKKGMSLSLKNETMPQLTKQNFAYKTIPSLSLKINL